MRLISELISYNTQDSYHRIIFNENIDAVYWPEVQNYIVKLVTENNINSFRADMSNITFLDSTGIGTLLRIQKIMEDKKVNAIFENLPDSVVRALKLMKITGFYGTENQEEVT